MVKIKDDDFQIVYNNREEKMDKSDIRQQVEEFMDAAGQEVLGKPQVPFANIIRMRLRLILEEVGELLEACEGEELPGAKPSSVPSALSFLVEASCVTGPALAEDVDLKAVTDALADIDYVVEGMRLALGINGKPIADEVHRSNMAKFADEVEIFHHVPLLRHAIARANNLPIPEPIKEYRDLDPGWYYVDNKYPEHGCVGPFGTRQETEAHAFSAGYVFKREDGKHMKPKDWQPPDIAGELKKQGWENDS